MPDLEAEYGASGKIDVGGKCNRELIIGCRISNALHDNYISLDRPLQIILNCSSKVRNVRNTWLILVLSRLGGYT